MYTLVTEGIKVSVNTFYREEYSDPAKDNFLFSYTITIENLSEYTVQLLRRHWYIFDSIGEHREVEGEGVVGLQPILAPGDVHRYESACNLNSDMGTMHGVFHMNRLIDNTPLEVQIPLFEMIMPLRQN